MISFGIMSTWILPQMNNFWLSQKIIQSIHDHAPGLISEKNPLITIKYDEPSLAFYLSTKKIRIGSNLNAANPYLISKEELQVEKKGVFPIKIITSASAYNYSLGEWETFYVVIFHGLSNMNQYPF